MINYDQLPDIERKSLRALYFMPNHTGTAQEVAEKCYYPDSEIEQALTGMSERGLLHQATAQTPARYSPSLDMLEQMKAKNKTANQIINNGLADYQNLKKRFDLDARDSL